MALSITQKFTDLKSSAGETLTSVKNYLGKPVTYIKEVEWKKGGEKVLEGIKLVVKVVLFVAAALVLVAKTPYLFAFAVAVGFAFHPEVVTRLDNAKVLYNKSNAIEKAVAVVAAAAALPVTIQVTAAAFVAFCIAQISSRPDAPVAAPAKA